MFTFTRVHLGALLLASLPAVIVAQQPAPDSNDRLTVDLYLEMESVSDPQISPDERQIVYTRQWVDRVQDTTRSSLWIVNADGTRNRFLVDGSQARWSPQGDRLAYVAEGAPRGSQIFVRWMDAEGATTQITHVDHAPAALAWSPDGSRIGFAMLVEDRNEWPVPMPKPPAGAKWTEAPRIVERLYYRQDRLGFLDNGYRQIFVVPASGGTPRQLTTGPYNHDWVEWTPDGKSILFSGLRAEDAELQWRETEIYAVDVAGGAVRQLTKRRGPDNGPHVSPDGTRVAYTGFDWTRDVYIDSRIYVMNIDGSNPRLVSGDWDHGVSRLPWTADGDDLYFARSPSRLFWSGDGNSLYFTAESEGTQQLYHLPLAGAGAGKVVPVTQGIHMLSVSDMSSDGRAVGIRSTFHTPGDIVVVDVKTPDQVTQLTFVNDDVLAGKKLGDVREIRYTSADGLKIQGWYITPPDFDSRRKYPMQLHIHGGPHAMYNVGFNFGWQEMAANGYVILYTNPRGSSGYGSRFGNMIMNAYPGKDYEDLMAGVDHMLARGFIDQQNLFVTGCSGGGVLTAWTVGHTDRFAAAAANCSVVDWLSFVGTTDWATWYNTFDKLPWENPGEHLQRSPLSYVGNVKTPTLLMTGVQDLRTPIAQTEQFYSALKMRKVPTAMIRFNNEWHGTTRTPSNFLRTQLYLRHWFEKWKRPMASTSTASEHR